MDNQENRQALWQASLSFKRFARFHLQAERRVKNHLSSCQATSYHFWFYAPFNFDSKTDIIVPLYKYDNQKNIFIFEFTAYDTTIYRLDPS